MNHALLETPPVTSQILLIWTPIYFGIGQPEDKP